MYGLEYIDKNDAEAGTGDRLEHEYSDQTEPAAVCAAASARSQRDSLAQVQLGHWRLIHSNELLIYFCIIIKE